ncbi:MAG: hypothetical protein ACFB4I_18170 [Cyanophyceae cyanobacterium]
MHYLTQESLFMQMFEQGKATKEHFKELDKVVAQFYAQASTNDYIRRFGEVSKIRESKNVMAICISTIFACVRTTLSYSTGLNFMSPFALLRRCKTLPLR